MKIDKLKVNAFGGLKNKELLLKDKINIIHGNNEAGKTSLQEFIFAMFYGISKNKNGKEISNYDKYKPWNNENYSGKINYSLDDGTKYEVFRDFNKKIGILYNSETEDISDRFKIDKQKGLDFFEDQIHIDENTYRNTAISEQEGVRISQSNQNTMTQKLSNLITTGNDAITFEKSMDKLNKNQNERIGTERTIQRPLNKVEKEMGELIEKKSELEELRENAESEIEKKDILLEEIKELKIKEKFLKRLKTNMEGNRIRFAEVNVNQNAEKEYSEKIEYLRNKVDNNAEQNIKKEKINLKIYYICLIIFLILCILLFIFYPNKYIASISIVPLIILSVIILIKKIKNKNKIKAKIKEIIEIRDNIEKEISVLTKTREEKILEYSKKYDDLVKEIEETKDKIKQEYLKQMNSYYVLTVSDYKYEQILKELEDIENQIYNKEFKLHTIEQDMNNLNTQIEELTEIEEKLQALEDEKNRLLKLNTSFEIAKECLEKAYKEIKQNISPRFIQNLNKTISKISNGKYSNIRISDKDGLVVEVDTGEYIPVSRLSTGTIDQMYLSLRLSMLQELSSETVPIILDESFAYFDNQRLSNILEFISNEYKNYQIIIFTCSNREKNALEEMKIDYNICEI